MGMPAEKENGPMNSPKVWRTPIAALMTSAAESTTHVAWFLKIALDTRSVTGIVRVLPAGTVAAHDGSDKRETFHDK
jgi:hypothetical protein